MMPENDGRPARRPAPAGLLGMIALVVIVELALVSHDARFLTVGVANNRFAARAARAEAPGRDVLILGDSLLKFGALPRLVGDRLGRRAYNLALIGGQPAATYFLLRHALDAGARPSAVVVDFKANLLSVDPRINLSCYTELMDLRDCLDFARATRDRAFLGKLLLARLLPSVNVRDRARALALAALRGQADPAADEVPKVMRNWRVNLGTHLMPPDPAAAGRPAHWDEPSYVATPWVVHPTNARYIRRFLRLAREHGLPVYWAIPPITPRVQARREELGLDAAYFDFARSHLERFPNLTLVDGRHAGYAASQFVDAAHLDRHGAVAFSAALAEVLARDRPDGGPRVVALPAGLVNPPPPIAEDLEESRLALERADGGAVSRRR